MPESPSGAVTAAGHLSASDLKTGLLGAGAYLRRNYGILDNLNVFPVPDGDTGINMLTTFEAGLREISDAKTVGEVAKCLNEPMTRQSRGNSGFILARFFHGFFEATDPSGTISARHFSDGIAKGSYHVNTSLFSPVEGTMLTVIAAMADALRDGDVDDVLGALDSGLAAAREALFRTPQQLKILAKAGVVDSGALGFIFLMEGFRRALLSLDPADEDETAYRFPPDPTVASALDETEQMHRYCTEVLVRTNNGSPAGLADFLKAHGTSIALVAEGGLVKVHIHTDDPEAVVAHLSTLGEVEESKIEDMQEQMGLFAEEEDPDSVSTIVSFVPGPGFRDLFVQLGIEHTVQYSGELPSTAAVLDAIAAVASRNVIITPNNKNILPAVMLARDRAEKNVSILPTESVIQGLAALYGYSENASMQENMVNMNDCMELIDSFSVYRSTRKSVFDRTTIPEGDFFCVHSGHVIAVDPDPLESAMAGLRAFNPEEHTNLCVYHSTPESLATADLIRERVSTDFPTLEVESLFGGQPTEYLIISLE